jgi:hypothetical protein
VGGWGGWVGWGMRYEVKGTSVVVVVIVCG